MLSRRAALASASQLTLASLNTFKPRMAEVVVASISTLLKPSATTSTTTGFPRFLGSSALWTPSPACCPRGCLCKRSDGHMLQKPQTQTCMRTPTIDWRIVLSNATKQAHLPVVVLGVVPALDTASTTSRDEVTRITEPAAVVTSLCNLVPYAGKGTRFSTYDARL